jgi:hypothetical protein
MVSLMLLEVFGEWKALVGFIEAFGLIYSKLLLASQHRECIVS